MSLSGHDFLERAKAADVLTDEQLASSVDLHAAETLPAARDIADDLVRKNTLTPFQADRLLSGEWQQLVLGNYVLLNKLGQGGMGEVFKALHRRMDRLVALKVLPAAALDSEHAVQRFQREVRAVAKLNHPNIVTAFDADCVDDTHFLVMEFVQGRDLDALVRKQGPFPVAAAVDIIRQAALGLSHAHRAGVIHRDVKPSNFLLTSDGVVKVLDLGLARLRDGVGSPPDQETESPLTQTGMLMGTVDYMSPEQAVDTKRADERSDIYGLGCTLYFLLSGRSPFSGETQMERLLAHRDQPIPSLAPVAAGVSLRLESLFRRMMAKNPDDRSATMSALIESLASIQQDLEPVEKTTDPAAVEAASPSSATTNWSNVVRDKNEASSQVTYRLSSSRASQDTSDRSSSTAATRRPSRLLLPLAIVGLVVIAVAVMYRDAFLTPSDSGSLLIELNETGAMVMIVNERNVAESVELIGGLSREYELPVGQYRIDVTKEEFAPYSRSISIQAGLPTRLTVELLRGS